ncbi:NUDIX hydrolase [bacterium]|nr:NUDIX hydrolase [bacterium]
MGEVFRGRIITVNQDEVTLPNGGRATLDIVHHPGAAAVVALDAEGAVVLLRQYRHAAGGFIWEVPAGTLGAGEAPAACARRELEEETGLVAARWTPLGSIVTTPGFCDERIHLFLARELRETAAALEDDEVLTVSRVPLASALAMVARGEIEDAKSIAALYRAQVALG